ncbi:MAG: SMI1/KNR4 family protein [Anaeromyxobacter sp.]
MKEHFQVQRPPATEAAIADLRRWLGRDLPPRYLEFLLETDGAERGVHDLGGDRLRLWSATEVPGSNAGYGIQRWLPETFAVGSDGGDDAIVLDMSAAPEPERWPVVRVGFGALDRDEFLVQAPSFADWAALGFRLVSPVPPAFDLPSTEEVAKDVDRVLRRFPEGDDPF